MATKRQAELAATRMRLRMQKRGAHAIDARREREGPGFGVYVYFEKPPKPPLRPTTRLKSGDRFVVVPLHAVVIGKFGPE